MNEHRRAGHEEAGCLPDLAAPSGPLPLALCPSQHGLYDV